VEQLGKMLLELFEAMPFAEQQIGEIERAELRFGKHSPIGTFAHI
jgi:hypothetical protein